MAPPNFVNNRMFIREKLTEFVNYFKHDFGVSHSPETFLVCGGYVDQVIMMDELQEFVPHTCNQIYISDSKSLNCKDKSINHSTTLTCIGQNNIFSYICSNQVNSFDWFASILGLRWNNKTKNSLSTLYEKMNVMGQGVFVLETRNYLDSILQRLSLRDEWAPYVVLLLSEDMLFYDNTDLNCDVANAINNAGFDTTFCYSNKAVYEFFSLRDFYDYFNKHNKQLRLLLNKEVYCDLFLNILMELEKNFLITFENNYEITIKIPNIQTTIFFSKKKPIIVEKEQEEENQVLKEILVDQKQQMIGDSSENNLKELQVKRRNQVQDESEAMKLRLQQNQEVNHKLNPMKSPEKQKQYVTEKKNQVQDEPETKELWPQQKQLVQHKRSLMKPPEKQKQYVEEKRSQVQDEPETKKLRPQQNQQVQYKLNLTKSPEKQKQYVEEKRSQVQDEPDAKELRSQQKHQVHHKQNPMKSPVQQKQYVEEKRRQVQDKHGTKELRPKQKHQVQHKRNPMKSPEKPKQYVKAKKTTIEPQVKQKNEVPKVSKSKKSRMKENEEDKENIDPNISLMEYNQYHEIYRYNRW